MGAQRGTLEAVPLPTRIAVAVGLLGPVLAAMIAITVVRSAPPSVTGLQILGVWAAFSSLWAGCALPIAILARLQPEVRAIMEGGSKRSIVRVLVYASMAFGPWMGAWIELFTGAAPRILLAEGLQGLDDVARLLTGHALSVGIVLIAWVFAAVAVDREREPRHAPQQLFPMGFWVVAGIMIVEPFAWQTALLAQAHATRALWAAPLLGVIPAGILGVWWANEADAIGPRAPDPAPEPPPEVKP